MLTPTPSTEADYAAKTARARIDADGDSVAVLYRTNVQGRAMEAVFPALRRPISALPEVASPLRPAPLAARGRMHVRVDVESAP